MRLYLAGAGTAAVTGAQDEGGDAVRAACLAYPWKLESFHYIKKMRGLAKAFRDTGTTVFLDSGAFSMFTLNATVSLREYADYIKRNQDWIHVASNLDAIGKGREQDTYDNQKALEALGVQVCPVHHARDHDEWLVRYIEEGYDWIFLGGMVPETAQYLRRWLDRIFDKYLTHPDGTAKVKVHGFGMTTLELMERYPWYSVDSTSWKINSNFGKIYLDLPGTDNLLFISAQSGKKHELDAHFDTLAPLYRDAALARIREFGFDPAQLAASHDWRRAWNVKFFERFMARPAPVFKRRFDRSLFDD